MIDSQVAAAAPAASQQPAPDAAQGGGQSNQGAPQAEKPYDERMAELLAGFASEDAATTQAADEQARKSLESAFEDAEKLKQAAAQDGQPAGAADDKQKPEPQQPESDRDKAIGEIAFQEAKLRRAHGNFKQEQSKFRQEQEAWKPQVEFAGKLETAIKTGDPWQAVQALADRMGKPAHEIYFALSKAVADRTTEPTPQEVAERTAKAQMEAWKADQQKLQEQRDTQTREQTIAQEKAGSVAFVTEQLKTNEERWPILSGYDPAQVTNAALHVMAEHFAKVRDAQGLEAAKAQGLDFFRALDMLEEGKQAQAQKDYERAAARKRAAQGAQRPAGAPDTAPTQVAAPTGHQEPQSRPKTIEHAHTSEAGTLRLLPYEERMARWIAEGDGQG